MSNVPSSKAIRTPAELVYILQELKQAVAAGYIEQIRPDPSPFATDSSVEDIEEAGPWPDYIELRFRAPRDGARYMLSVDTYHGAGGTWGPE
ncbi:hypothetical protein [Vulgatibacter incomptus]|uniref:hypothetical protein n=1 Tax=Vulgatibacter incomptus TaxID=1391653 RepID=UPI000680876D|nr:hypothetical protein [Vulgatibacter incomptus]